MGEHAPSYRRILATLGELIEDVDGSSSNAFWRGWKHRDFDSFHERPLLALACLRNEVGDESDPVAPASLRLHLGVEGTLRALELARTSYHPVALTIAADAVGQFERGTRN
jgi:hypothetical protein